MHLVTLFRFVLEDFAGFLSLPMPRLVNGVGRERRSMQGDEFLSDSLAAQQLSFRKSLRGVRRRGLLSR
jgi:hypothetical protein